MVKNTRAFTLVELLVAIILTGIISFFIYTMVTYSYTGFSKLYSHSGNFEDMKMFISSLRKSVVFADKIEFTNQSLKCTRYDMYENSYVKIEEEYKFLDVNRLLNNREYARTIRLGYIPTSSYPATRGELYKMTYISDNVSENKIIAFNNKIANCIRKIFYFLDTSNDIVTLDMYIVYDDIVDEVFGSKESYVTKGQWLCFSLKNVN